MDFVALITVINKPAGCLHNPRTNGCKEDYGKTHKRSVQPLACH